MTEPWPTGWSPIDNPIETARLEQELRREVPTGHVLFDKPVTLIGKGKRDDYLFQLADDVVAWVHLTWAVETDPTWPWTELYPSFAEWAQAELHDEAES